VPAGFGAGVEDEGVIDPFFGGAGLGPEGGRQLGLGGRRFRLRRGELKKLPSQVTWTTRLRKDAAVHGLPPGRTGRRGRPPTKGERLPALARLTATTAFTQVTVTRYGRTAAISAAALTCLWPSVFGTRAVTVALIRDRSTAGHDLALVTTDTATTAAQVIERYAARWSIEVAIEDARQVFGAGQARNRTACAVERTIPFQLAC
jgi:hypothetical protein